MDSSAELAYGSALASSELIPVIEAALQFIEAINVSRQNLAQMKLLGKRVEQCCALLQEHASEFGLLKDLVKSLTRKLIQLRFFTRRLAKWSLIGHFWLFYECMNEFETFFDDVTSVFTQLSERTNTFDPAIFYHDKQNLRLSQSEDKTTLDDTITRMVEGFTATHTVMGLSRGSEITLLRILRFLRCHPDVKMRDDLARFMDFLLSRSNHPSPLNVHIITPSRLLDLPSGLVQWRRMTVDVRRFSHSKTQPVLDNLLSHWSNLQHPNIVELFAVAFEADVVTLVMPVYQSGDITAYLQHNPMADKHSLIIQIAMGLRYLHQAGILHGNLRGQNIMISDIGTVKLCNFGLQQINTSSSDSRSICWKSPETISHSHHSEASDVYSFGVTLWEILTSSQPWEGYSSDEVVTRIQNGEQLSLASGFNEIHAKIMRLSWQMQPPQRPTAFEICWLLNGMAHGDTMLPNLTWQSFNDINSLLHTINASQPASPIQPNSFLNKQ